MDFFGNVQSVEVEAVSNNTGNEFVEDLRRLEEIVRRKEAERRLCDENGVAPGLGAISRLAKILVQHIQTLEIWEARKTSPEQPRLNLRMDGVSR